VNAFIAEAIEPAEFTVTVAGPAVPGGVVAWIIVEPVSVTLVAGLPPTVTVEPGAKPEPEIEILVPPWIGPEVGLTV
jgi:hypothetical protein